MRIRQTLRKIRRDPVGAIKRAFFKTVVGPLKYGRGDDYDAEKYWAERLAKYGSSLQGPGDEGLPHRDNEEVYEQAARILFDEIAKRGLALDRADVLEIGSGNGYYTEQLLRRGARRLCSVDITDVMFAAISTRLAPVLATTKATLSLEKLDITSEQIQGLYDLVLFIDVIEHIITKPKLSYALTNIASVIKPGGLLLVAPVAKRSRSHLFHNSEWALDDLLPFFANWDVGETVAFRGTSLVTLRRPG
jgi:2-polyprenyl-3-methyl-5-hydroxy-6-metoxy-1,4-benzoquinol methylase